MTCVGTELVKDAAKIPKGTMNHQTFLLISGSNKVKQLSRDLKSFDRKVPFNNEGKCSHGTN
ncbi:unnamed protein product [Trifolium pratense]|uniref:Uncharacterized protein n=1 Tax=Trifolium pratense TaxID=57577 RepID=A0ACB0JBC2_TRIPR|nr:unnamed protein product [Trifolium pratense]